MTRVRRRHIFLQRASMARAAELQPSSSRAATQVELLHGNWRRGQLARAGTGDEDGRRGQGSATRTGGEGGGPAATRKTGEGGDRRPPEGTGGAGHLILSALLSHSWPRRIFRIMTMTKIDEVFGLWVTYLGIWAIAAQARILDGIRTRYFWSEE